MAILRHELDLLIAAGVPVANDGVLPEFVGFEQLVPIVKKILDDHSEPKVQDALRGWLIALHDHFLPSVFEKHFHDPCFKEFIKPPITGRDIKLRRIALSHLGKIA